MQFSNIKLYASDDKGKPFNRRENLIADDIISRAKGLMLQKELKKNMGAFISLQLQP